MKNKKRIIIIGAAVVLLAAVSAIVVGIHRNPEEYMDLEDEAWGYETQADFDGNPDESEYEPDGENAYGEDLDETQDEPEEEYYKNHTPDEILAKLQSQREKDGFRTGEEDSGNAYRDEDDNFYNEFVDDVDDFEESGESADISEIGAVVYESKGYAQDEVLCNVESQEEAESVAAQISGTLASWEHGVAVIKIDSPVDDFLEKLEQQGSGLNLYRHFYY